MDLPKRKTIRLGGFDYNLPGTYFITICTKNHEYLLWEDGAYSEDNGYKLSEYGKIIKFEVERISEKYPTLNVDNYVIMPNHVHLLITIERPYDPDVATENKKYTEDDMYEVYLEDIDKF